MKTNNIFLSLGIIHCISLLVGLGNGVIAQTTFGSQQVIVQTETDGANSVYAADIDGDGDMDVLSSSSKDNKIAWYANDGAGNFGVQQIINSAANGATKVYAADLDGDGDMDVLSATYYDVKIAWYANDGAGNFGAQQVISTATVGARAVYAADLDGDGDMDVLSISNFIIEWYENDGAGNFGVQQIISVTVNGANSVYAADIDGDGDMDVLSAAAYDVNIAWYANDGVGNFGAQQIISIAADNANTVYASDLDGDGDLDVLSASSGDDKIAWYANDGTGNFGVQQIISTVAISATSVYAADIDGDGDMDVLSASFNDDKIAWYANDGAGNFDVQQIISSAANGAGSVYTADLDGDGDMDVLSTSYLEDKIAWYANDGAGNFDGQQIISTGANAATSVYAADIDGDGDMDVLSASAHDYKIAWYANDGLGNFGWQQIISYAVNGAWSVYAADMDGDGDMDVLSASLEDDKIAWYENNGLGNFGGQQIISTAINGPFSVYAADIDGDGYMDVLSASAGDNKIAWYENDGLGNFGGQQIITTSANYAISVYAADLDGDGDMDVLSASAEDDKIAWYENDGTGNFGAQLIISTSADWATCVYATDLDGDGDIDVLSASAGNDKIAWYENDGAGNFGGQLIINAAATSVHAVYATDLDEDGDMDVLSDLDTAIVWYENTGGGNFNSQQTISTAVDGVVSLYAADLDDDGDMDVLSASFADDKIAWYENLLALNVQVSVNSLPCIGAANGSVLVQATGGEASLLPPYTYTWASDSGTSGNGVAVNDIFTIDNLAAGTYSITVSNAAGDTNMATITLNTVAGSVFEITDITTINSSNNLPNASIQLTIEGGTAPFAILWSGTSNGSFSSISPVFTVDNLIAGSYAISITDAEGKTVAQNVMLLDETNPQNTCNQPLDIVILNDASGSVDAVEYNESKQFFVDFINALNIGTADTQSRAAIVEWSGSIIQQTRIPITGNLSDLQNYVSYSRLFEGGTNPNEALTFGYNYLESVARPFATKILVLSTDGTSGQVGNSLVALAETYKALGYIIVTIAFDGAYSNPVIRNILTQTASIPLLAPGAPAYSLLLPDLAGNIVNLYVCPADPGSSNTYYFYRDGAIDINGYTANGFCPNPYGINIFYTVSALQQLSLPAGTPITFYYNNPALFGATPILTTFIPCAIPAGTSETFYTFLPINAPAQVFAVLNDDGSQTPPFTLPVTDIAEHVFVNNIDNIAICTDPIATVSVSLTAITPVPVCGNTVLFNVSACNISTVDAVDVAISPQIPAGFVLINQHINLNGCSQPAGTANTFNIPSGCCVSITYEYDVSGAVNGFYNDQDVLLSGPFGQVYLNFDGATSSADDLTVTGIPDCPSDVVLFTKTANVTQTCDDSFVTYTFTIDNQTNLPLQGLTFYDLLPSPVIWAAEPYLLNGLSIGQTNITGSQTAQFTIAEVQPNTLTTFYLDAYLGNWTQSGILSNSATVSGFPAFVNSNGNPITANAQDITVQNSPHILINSPIAYTNCIIAQLSATIQDGANPQWITAGDGVFSNPNSLPTTYTPGPNDLLNGSVWVSIGTQNECGDYNANIQLQFGQVPICEDDDCNTDDLLNPDTCECEYLPIATPDCNDNNPLTDDNYNSDTCLCENVMQEQILLFPNAFSPNQDNYNDLFRATYNQPVTTIYLAVYNRWGQRVFETTDILQGWNGMFDEQSAPIGVYAWYAVYTFATETDTRHISGNVTLIR